MSFKIFLKKYSKIKRKASKRNNIFLFILKISPVLVIIIALSFSVFAFLSYIAGAPVFIIKDVNVIGAPDIKENIVSYFLGRHQARVSLKTSAAIIRGENPQVKYVDIKRILPDKIIVEVYKKRPVALISISGKTYPVNDSGFVLKQISKDAAKFLPQLTGIEMDNVSIIQNEIVDSKRLRRALSILRNIASHNFLGNHTITGIKIRDFKNPVAFVDGTVPLYFGLNNINNETSMVLKEIFSKIEDIKNIEYVDLRSRNVFVKRKTL
ncbi:hypothetical protein B9J78_06000 [bacterium Unc6]|nr:hypothetical protein [bacterium Unc6]